MRNNYTHDVFETMPKPHVYIFLQKRIKNCINQRFCATFAPKSRKKYTAISPPTKNIEKPLYLLTFTATPCIMTEFYGDIKYQA